MTISGYEAAMILQYCLVIVKRGLELDFKSNLALCGLWAYVPLFMQKTKPRSKHTYVIVGRVLFPGYAFVLTDGSWEELDVIKACEGFKSIIAVDQRVVGIPIETVHQFRQRELNGEFDAAIENGIAIDVSIGTSVRVKSGPFAGHTGAVEKVSKRAGQSYAHISGPFSTLKISLAQLEQINPICTPD